MLELVTDASLEALHNVLAMPPPEDDPKLALKHGHLMVAAARTGINAQLRVDENRLRSRRDDILPRILETIKAEKAKLVSVN